MASGPSRTRKNWDSPSRWPKHRSAAPLPIYVLPRDVPPAVPPEGRHRAPTEITHATSSGIRSVIRPRARGLALESCTLCLEEKVSLLCERRFIVARRPRDGG
jgi:hypothetical protein